MVGSNIPHLIAVAPVASDGWRTPISISPSHSPFLLAVRSRMDGAADANRLSLGLRLYPGCC